MDPITRKEMFLAKAGGQSVRTPDPITREEMFLKKIAENGGGGGATSWNDLTHKPFGEEDAFEPIVLPDDIDYSVNYDFSAVMGEAAGTFVFYKVNHEINTNVSYENCILDYPYWGSHGNEYSFKKLEIAAIPAGCSLFEYLYWLVWFTEDNLEDNRYVHHGYLLAVDSENAYGIPVGVYVCVLVQDAQRNLPLTISKTIIHPIDPKYLPEPELLGEIVVNSENTTNDGSTTIDFNEELAGQMSALFDKVRNSNKPVVLNVIFADVVMRTQMSYMSSSQTLGVYENLSADVLMFPASGTYSRLLFRVDRLNTNEESGVVDLLAGGAEFTFRFYA